MGEHGWIFPWFAVVAGAVALVVGCLIGGWRVSQEIKWPISLIVIWLIASIALFIASLHLGALSGVDYIATRGFLLGTVSGLVLSALARTLPAGTFAPALLGAATLSVAAGRLWLTHGEISGLTALALGASVTVLCLAIVPALASTQESADLLASCRAAISALLFLVGLDICVQLGFTKADALDKMYWADLPLLLAAALSLGALVAACLPERTRRTGLIPALILVAAGALAAIPLSAKLAASWDFAGLLALGAIVCGFAIALPAGAPATESRSPASPALLGALLLVVAGATVAFAVWSGYGLALFLLGGWFSCGWSLMARDENAPAGVSRPSDIAAMAMFGFGAVLLVYRIATLQSGSGIRSSGPGDIWDLFAICLGALLSLMIAQWAVQQAGEARLPSALAALQWLIAAIVPVLVLEYIWRPRALAAFVVGAALAQLVAVLGASIRQMAAANATSLVLAITLLDFLPWIGGSESPTRSIRLVLIVVLALVIVLRILLPARLSGARPAAEG